METLDQQGDIFGQSPRNRSSASRVAIQAQSYAPGGLYAPTETQLRRTNANERTRTMTRTRSRERYRERQSVPTPARGYYTQTYDDEGSVYSADRFGHDDPDNGFQLSALDPGGYRLLLARDCQSIIDQRLAEFAQFKRKAQALQQSVSLSHPFFFYQSWSNRANLGFSGRYQNTHKTETRKDYHDQAVYAFTIVTVIFLPLSAVSSIFGMNTSDLRDLEQGQWLYWATALPVTAGVILIGLWWMGELGNAALWLLNLRQRQSAPAVARKQPRAYTRLQRVRVYSDSDDDDEELEALEARVLRRSAPSPRVIRNSRY